MLSLRPSLPVPPEAGKGTPMTTNANSPTLATLIADSSRCARFASSLVTTLKGSTRLAPGEKRGGLKITRRQRHCS